MVATSGENTFRGHRSHPVERIWWEHAYLVIQQKRCHFANSTLSRLDTLTKTMAIRAAAQIGTWVVDAIRLLRPTDKIALLARRL